MGIISRTLHGGINMLTAPLRIAATPFTFVAKMAGTALKAAGQLATLQPIEAIKTAIGGTAKNAMDAGVTLVSAGNPAIAFADGFARNRIRFS